MIIKEKDAIDANLEQLTAIIQVPHLAKEKRLQAEKELKILKSGNQGEQDSAYFIDFHYKDSKNWAIIHDLRIKYGGLTAQIDHLLVNRFLDFYVLETKHYARGIKVTQHGEFLVSFQKRYIAIESPIEQNQRHVTVLKKLLKGKELLPKRLGFSIQPRFLPYILVSPKSRVIRPKAKAFNTNCIIKSDQFYKQTRKNIDNESLFATVGSVAKMISPSSLRTISETLASHHQPAKIDYYSRFAVSKTSKPEVAEVSKATLNKQGEKSKYYCYSCKASISKKVAVFCFNNKVRFKSRAYCFNCQKTFSVS